MENKFIDINNLEFNMIIQADSTSFRNAHIIRQREKKVPSQV